MCVAAFPELRHQVSRSRFPTWEKGKEKWRPRFSHPNAMAKNHRFGTGRKQKHMKHHHKPATICKHHQPMKRDRPVGWTPFEVPHCPYSWVGGPVGGMTNLDWLSENWHVRFFWLKKHMAEWWPTPSTYIKIEYCYIHMLCSRLVSIHIHIYMQFCSSKQQFNHCILCQYMKNISFETNRFDVISRDHYPLFLNLATMLGVSGSQCDPQRFNSLLAG